jgi:hypothetical protein
MIAEEGYRIFAEKCTVAAIGKELGKILHDVRIQDSGRETTT